jgi:copper homeostasis protein
MSVLVEICCGSVKDVVESEKGGAQRVELCTALPLGGLTPTAGTISEAKRLTSLPLIVMIRLRSGGFCYSEAELSTMERDMDLAAELGADGFVFGVLCPDGTVDRIRNSRLVKRANGLPTVFHRAFDVTPDPFEALESIIELGMTRILTSGQKSASLEGTELIRQLVERANNRIEIMPGGGVRSENVARIVSLTGCNQVHLTAHKSHLDSSTYANRKIAFGSDSAPSEDRVDVIDRSVVAEIVRVAGQL